MSHNKPRQIQPVGSAASTLSTKGRTVVVVEGWFYLSLLLSKRKSAKGVVVLLIGVLGGKLGNWEIKSRQG